MRTAVLAAPGEFQIIEQEQPSAAAGQVVIRIHSCGICTSELDMWLGKAHNLEFPLFIGHEVSGVIHSIGDQVPDLQPGTPVAVWSDGRGYAEFLATDPRYVVPLQPATVLDLALGEPIACSVNGVRKADPRLNDSVAIVGCGFMGLIMLQVFKLRGAGLVCAIDTRDSVLALARVLGADHTFNPLQDDVPEAVRSLTAGQGVDIGVEAAGNQKTLDLTADLVRMEGKLEVFGYHQGAPRTVNWGHWNWMAFQIINGHTRNPDIYMEGMRLGLQLLESGRLNLECLVTHRFALEDINAGFEQAARKSPDFIKGVIRMNPLP